MPVDPKVNQQLGDLVANLELLEGDVADKADANSKAQEAASAAVLAAQDTQKAADESKVHFNEAADKLSSFVTSLKG